MSGRHSIERSITETPLVDVRGLGLTPRQLHERGRINDRELAATEGRHIPAGGVVTGGTPWGEETDGISDYVVEVKPLRSRIPKSLAERLAAPPSHDETRRLLTEAIRDGRAHFAPDLEAHAHSFNLGWATHVEQIAEFDAAAADDVEPEDVDLDPVAERVTWWPKPVIFDDPDGNAAVVILTRPGIGYSGYDGMIVTNGPGILNVTRRLS